MPDLQATPNPVTALVWFAAAVVLLVVLFLPRAGMVARVGRLRRLTARVRIEDALKHLLNRELAGETASPISLAGALETSHARAHELVSRLVASGLVATDAGALRLTHEGRAYALRILRTHRLLERFFADQTGLAPGQWHDLAETREHVVSAAEVESLAAKMGDPLVDPHGDPIPTAQGRLPATSGLTLASLEPGAAAEVVHVEDEPAPVYHRLVELGLNPGVVLRVLARDGQTLVVMAAGRELRLGLLEAAAVTIELAHDPVAPTVLFERLDALRSGEDAEVVEIAPAVQGAQRRRLLDLGVLPGTRITAEIRSPSGEPMAYRIRGALIALRRTQANAIYIRRPAERTDPSPPAPVATGAAA